MVGPDPKGVDTVHSWRAGLWSPPRKGALISGSLPPTKGVGRRGPGQGGAPLACWAASQGADKDSHSGPQPHFLQQEGGKSVPTGQPQSQRGPKDGERPSVSPSLPVPGAGTLQQSQLGHFRWRGHSFSGHRWDGTAWGGLRNSPSAGSVGRGESRGNMRGVGPRSHVRGKQSRVGVSPVLGGLGRLWM